MIGSKCNKNIGLLFIKDESGFTLIEVLVYMVISGMLLAIAMVAFIGQNKSYNRQDIIAEIQQNIRGATEQMSSDIRFAGVGLREETEDPFVYASTDSLAINLWSDLNDYWGAISSDEKRTVYYRFDQGTTTLLRAYTLLGGDPTGNWQTLAEDIEHLRFEYLVNNGTSWDWLGTVPIVRLDEIKAVKIVMMGAARESVFNTTDNMTYSPPIEGLPAESDWIPGPRTGYKRMMSIIIQCRNNRG